MCRRVVSRSRCRVVHPGANSRRRLKIQSNPITRFILVRLKSMALPLVGFELATVGSLVVLQDSQSVHLSLLDLAHEPLILWKLAWVPSPCPKSCFQHREGGPPTNSPSTLDHLGPFGTPNHISGNCGIIQCSPACSTWINQSRYLKFSSTLGIQCRSSNYFFTTGSVTIDLRGSIISESRLSICRCIFLVYSIWLLRYLFGLFGWWCGCLILKGWLRGCEWQLMHFFLNEYAN
jgi:hypothetical protein